MKRKNDSSQTSGTSLFDLLIYGVFTILIIMFLIFLSYEFKEYDTARQRDIVKESLEYSESQITQLQTIMDNWLQLETEKNQTEDTGLLSAYTAQQGALIERMSIIVNRIDHDLIPVHLIEFVNDKGVTQ